MLLAAAVIAVPLIQLIPLPAPLWALLPGREEAALAPALAGAAPGWAAISLAPDQTWAAALGLIPGSGIFLACLVVDPNGRFRLIALLLVGVALSMALGALQLASGANTFHLDERTADGAVSGFFVNCNHLAALILMSLPFAAVLATPGRSWPVSHRVLRWGCALFGLLAVVTLAAIRSRAGIVLLAPAILMCLLIIMRSSPPGYSLRALRLWAGGVAGAGLAVLAFGLSPLMARFESAGGGQDRLDRWPEVLEAAGRYQPIGGGVGSFRPIYSSVEPITELDDTFFNHAHNDYLELWLETGWLGVAVLALAVIWIAPRWVRVWQKGPHRNDDTLALASGAALILIALHSVVDFPIRSTTNFVVVALCFGLVAAADLRRRPTGVAVVKGSALARPDVRP